MIELSILFKLTSRSRPFNLIRALDSIETNVTNPNYQILISMDSDDISCNNADFIRQIGQNYGWHVYMVFGNSKNKIDAINRDIENFKSWDILVNVSDDQIFTQKGFDERIRLAFLSLAPDLDGFIHFRDSNHNPIDALSTLSIIGRKYFERDNYIYHPEFKSFFCDNLAQDLAKARGKYHFVNEIIFDHLHASYGKSQNDELYRKNDKYWRQDELLYKKLKSQIRKMI